MTLNDLLRRLHGVRKSSDWHIAKCPGHNDRSPSMTVRLGRDRILVHCFAGCSSRAIVGALGLKLDDLLFEPCDRDYRPKYKPKPRELFFPAKAPIPLAWQNCAPHDEDPLWRAMVYDEVMLTPKDEPGAADRATTRYHAYCLSLEDF